MRDLILQVGQKRELVHAITLIVLIFGRLVFAVFFTPFFGGARQVPARIKMGCAAALTAVLYPALSKTLPAAVPLEVFAVVGLFLKECLVGLLIGLLASMAFYGIQAAGQFIDNQRGLSHAAIFNPALGAQASQMSQFLFQMAVVIFFVIGGHRVFITALFESFEVLPLVVYPKLAPDFSDPSLQLLARGTARVLFIALQLSAPVAIAMFLCEVVLGVANRVAPQMDVQFISYTLKALTGLLFIFVSLHLIIEQMHHLFEDDFVMLRQLIQGLPGV